MKLSNSFCDGNLNTPTHMTNNSLDNRIDLIRAIQKCMGKSVGNKRKFQTASANIFLQTFGADLTALKEGIGAIQSPELLLAPGTDALEHVGDLTHLVYGNKNIVEHVEVLQHFAVQAADCERSIRVISDIDDTLYPGYVSLLSWNSSHNALGGSTNDTRCICCTPE